MRAPVFVPGEMLLPKEGADLKKWAVLACDQFTSQPEYWEDVSGFAADAPSTLRIILPEVYLEKGDTRRRIEDIHAAMREYKAGVLRCIGSGFIYVERRIAAGVRQGLVGCIDLEAYSYAKGGQPRIRPSENTVVERIPPRLEVRRGAELESPHILMLVDDPNRTVIEPIAAQKTRLTPLYETELMFGGGHLAGWAVTGRDDIEAVYAALAKIEEEEAFSKRYAAAGKTSPFALAVGDGNHSLATAKALWEELKARLPLQRLENHPARYCLAELENIHCPANRIKPIHRVVFGCTFEEMIRAAEEYARETGASTLDAEDAFGAGRGIGPLTVRSVNESRTLRLAGTREPLTVGVADAIISKAATFCPGLKVDYVHGKDSVDGLVQSRNAIGILLPPFEKADIFRGIALGGVLPKKTFSMGAAQEKRYYMECRAIL